MSLYLPNEKTIVLFFFGVIVFLFIMFILYSISRNKQINKLKRTNKDLKLIINKNSNPLYLVKVKEDLENRFLYMKEIIDIIYKTCDNPPKFKEKIGSKFLEDKENKLLKNLFYDIFYVTNQYSNGLIDYLKEEFHLTEAELRLCCLLYWGFNNNQICTIENIIESSYYVKCFRIKVKLKLNKEERISDFLKKYQLKLA